MSDVPSLPMSNTATLPAEVPFTVTLGDSQAGRSGKSARQPMLYENFLLCSDQTRIAARFLAGRAELAIG